MPTRAIDRKGSLAFGLRGGSLYSGYADGPAYADLGLGATVRYRTQEPVGLELIVEHNNQTFSAGSERAQTQVGGSVVLFAFPWSRFQPYVFAGATHTALNIHDDIGRETVVSTRSPLFGPHAGAGLELGLGDAVGLDLEARYVGYLNGDQGDPAGALTTTVGVVFHF